MRPCGETNEAVQPPSETTAASGAASGLARMFESMATPIFLKFSTCCGSVICIGIHMPPGFE